MPLLSTKMAKWLFIIVICVLLASCSSRPKQVSYTTNIAESKSPTIAAPVVPQSYGQIALSVARKMLGTPYRYGGSDPRGFDCSGLVQYSFRQAGITLPRTSRDIFRSSQLVSPAERQPGDLVFFAISAKGKISHVGIYSDDNRFIHSPSSGKGVSYASLDNPYWRSKLIGVGRI